MPLIAFSDTEDPSSCYPQRATKQLAKQELSLVRVFSTDRVKPQPEAHLEGDFCQTGVMPAGAWDPAHLLHHQPGQEPQGFKTTSGKALPSPYHGAAPQPSEPRGKKFGNTPICIFITNWVLI